MTDNTREIGKWGEEEATIYLKDKGYSLLFNNWRAERGDIDIIALDKDCLVFVEVKGGFSETYRRKRQSNQGAFCVEQQKRPDNRNT